MKAIFSKADIQKHPIPHKHDDDCIVFVLGLTFCAVLLGGAVWFMWLFGL